MTTAHRFVIDRALARRPAAPRLRGALEAPRTVPLALTGLILVALAARIVLGRHVLAPWIMADELEYSELAKSFAASGHYFFREHPLHARTIYPALISPAWFAHSMAATYALAKAANAVLMTAAAVPLYLWARRLVSSAWALLAVVLFLAIPSFIYTDEILTENAYAPAVVLALFALALALERPTLPRQILTLGLAALAASVRLQGLVFVLIVPTAVVLKIFFDLRSVKPSARGTQLRKGARAWWPTGAALLALAVLYVSLKALIGASLSSSLGIYGPVAHTHYSVREASRWVVYHFADLAFSVGVIPFSALIVLTGLACRRRSVPSPAERAFLAATLAAVFWTVVQVGAFASRFSLRVEERYLFNIAPALLLAVVLWLARGLPRPPRLTAAAALVPMALLLMFPYTSFFNGALFNDTFGLIPLARLATHIGNTAELRIFVGLGLLVAGLLFASVPQRLALWLVPAAIFVFFIVSSATVDATVTRLSRAARDAGGLQGDPSWIDDAIGEDKRVEFLYTTDIDPDPHVLWQAEFWNRSVRRVFGVTSQDASIPDVAAPLNSATGRIVPQLTASSPDRNPRYVIAASNVHVAGTRIARAGMLALYRVRPPLGLASITSGVTPDGWTGASAAYTRYLPHARGARLDVSVWRPKISAPPPHVSIAVGRVRVVKGAATIGRVWLRRRWTVADGTQHIFRLPLRPGPFRVELVVGPTFSPAQYGSPDARTLGVLVSFRLSYGRHTSATRSRLHVHG